MNAGVLQGSPLSPILFLFYNADLLDLCCNLAARTIAIGFIDNINILVYRPSIESNYRKLEATYRKYLE